MVTGGRAAPRKADEAPFWKDLATGRGAGWLATWCCCSSTAVVVVLVVVMHLVAFVAQAISSFLSPVTGPWRKWLAGERFHVASFMVASRQGPLITQTCRAPSPCGNPGAEGISPIALDICLRRPCPWIPGPVAFGDRARARGFLDRSSL